MAIIQSIPTSGSSGSGSTYTNMTTDEAIAGTNTEERVISAKVLNDAIDNKIPTIPTVNNGTLTIQKNGTTIKTFTANASENVTCNIEIPTKISDLTNDSNFLTSTDILNKADKATTLSGYGITDAYTKTQVDTKISNLVNSAPETLDTLNELASALGNDPNFATTVATQIGNKANDSDVVHKSGDESIVGTKTFSSQIKGNISGTSSDVVVGSDTATSRGYLVDGNLPRYTWENGSQLIAGQVPLITDFNNLSKPGVYHVVFCLNDGYVHEEKEYKESLNRPSIPNITTGFRDGILEIKQTSTMHNITSYPRVTQKLTLLSSNSNYGFNGRTYQRVCLNLSNNTWTAWKGFARDEEVVHTSGDESIGGAKTFTDNVTCASSLILNGYVCTIE